jgi:protein-L-isoaspartate(D-aspartate) O-methyltransferase
MVAQMLELLAPAPGDRILEIGTGSGYNAALLSELAGPMGSVTTIELDSELATRARALLRDECGYPNVRVVVGDGSAGVDAATGFDGIVVTARCDDVAAAWWDALREGGRIVLPLQLGDDGEYAVGFARRGARLESIGISPCAFIALRGEASAAGKGSAEAFYRSGVKTAGGKTRKALESVVAVRKRDAKPELLAQADVVLARHVSLFAIRYA